MVGYQCYDVPSLPPLWKLKTKADTYTVHTPFGIPRIVGRSGSTFVYGAALWKPGFSSYNTEGSLRKRLYHQPPPVGDLGLKPVAYDHISNPCLDGSLDEPSRQPLYDALLEFVDKWCSEHLTPLDHLMSFEEALEHTSYSLKRKERMRRAAGRADPNRIWDYPVKCFIKDEWYEEPKFPRMISARVDEAKALYMPIFRSIEEEVYKLPYFVKHMTTQERIVRVHELFGLDEVYVTDYSAFETHFVPELMNACEMRVYRYMLRNFPAEFRLVERLAGMNHLWSKLFHGKILGVRMSGEMNTSLGNGVSNLLLMLFAAYMTKNEVLAALVEGDDGLFKLKHPPQQQFFVDMGLELKCCRTQAYRSGFCGLNYNPVTLRNCSKPLSCLMKMGWVGTRYAASSIKKVEEVQTATAYSYASEMKGVPLVWAMCKKIISRRHITYARAWKYYDTYWREHVTMCDEVVEPSMEDRTFFSEVTGISVADQLTIECDILHSEGPIRSPTLLAYLPSSYVDAWDFTVEGETL